MSRFLFFLEYDGKRTISNPYDESISIASQNINEAVKTFARKEGFKISSVDFIKSGEYRAFFAKRRFWKETLEVIFYVKTA